MQNSAFFADISDQIIFSHLLIDLPAVNMLKTKAFFAFKTFGYRILIPSFRFATGTDKFRYSS